ncbi:hypothetical protein NCC49_002547 [Naganishia albida]|nr:hypothetical protein NCC49_002547 [Naganishia albida]
MARSTSYPAGMGKYNMAHRWEQRSLLIAVNCVAALSIFFFGYDQGLMGGVNTNRHYARTMGFGYFSEEKGQVEVTHPLLQGGIVAVYYLPGTLLGAFIGGWLGDKFGRVRTIAIGSAWTIFGAVMQTSAQNSDWMFCARVLNGIGTGILCAITPVWATEISSHMSRGAFIAIEFTLNIFGVVVAYWLEYGTSFYYDKESSFIWRFPVAFQIVPLFGLLAATFFCCESPRWLIKMGREEEGRYILGRLRGEHDGVAEAEFQDIVNVVKLERESTFVNSYWKMFFGIGSGKLHIGRRVQLVICFQLLLTLCFAPLRIAGITIYGPTIFEIAGIKVQDRQWLAGTNNITYMFATLICVFTLDRIGRRWTLYWGSIGQGICMFAAGGLARATINAAEGNKSRVGGAATFFVFLYTAIFGATWLTVPWIYPAEIFPLEVRARGNAWGVVGWSIGNGWCVLLLPTIFQKLNEKTLYLFGAVNVLTIFTTWAFYVEPARRTLEDIDLLFTSDSYFVWNNEKDFKRLKEEQAQAERIREDVSQRRDTLVEDFGEDKEGKVTVEHL